MSKKQRQKEKIAAKQERNKLRYERKKERKALSKAARHPAEKTIGLVRQRSADDVTVAQFTKRVENRRQEAKVARATGKENFRPAPKKKAFQGGSSAASSSNQAQQASASAAQPAQQAQPELKKHRGKRGGKKHRAKDANAHAMGSNLVQQSVKKVKKKQKNKGK